MDLNERKLNENGNYFPTHEEKFFNKSKIFLDCTSPLMPFVWFKDKTDINDTKM